MVYHGLKIADDQDHETNICIRCVFQVFAIHYPILTIVALFSLKNLEVLQSLKSQVVSPVAPFPLSEQYVKNVAAARVAAGGDSEQGEKTKETSRKEDPKSKVSEGGSNSGWMYGSKRKEYISGLVAGGMDYKGAASHWDDSHDKAVYLSEVSVSELKRRKFLPAGAKENPWHKKIHGK